MTSEPESLVPLLEPRDGVPDPITEESALASATRALSRGHGPLAVDTERASGYRYYQRAYLVQVRREGAGTFLIDPIAVPDLSGVARAVEGAEWVLHAASQDLPALLEVGMWPTTLFDTELAGRLSGLDRVALGALAANLLGTHIEKGHGAADWSTRPLPADWLTYAALDVELLVELRDVLAEMLDEQGKLAWARAEFAAVLRSARTPAPARTDPWRRTSGINKVRGARRLAVVRSLWEARDDLARTIDVAPGRVLHDSAIVAVATSMPENRQSMRKLPGFRSRNQRARMDRWWDAAARAYALEEADLPGSPVRGGDGPPPANRWARQDPQAAKRLARMRSAVAQVAETVTIPVENLLTPALVRRLAWSPPEPATADHVAHTLEEGGARHWQVELTASPLADALQPDAPQAPRASGGSGAPGGT